MGAADLRPHPGFCCLPACWRAMSRHRARRALPCFGLARLRPQLQLLPRVVAAAFWGTPGPRWGGVRGHVCVCPPQPCRPSPCSCSHLDPVLCAPGCRLGLSTPAPAPKPLMPQFGPVSSFGGRRGNEGGVSFPFPCRHRRDDSPFWHPVDAPAVTRDVSAAPAALGPHAGSRLPPWVMGRGNSAISPSAWLRATGHGDPQPGRRNPPGGAEGSFWQGW